MCGIAGLRVRAGAQCAVKKTVTGEIHSNIQAETCDTAVACAAVAHYMPGSFMTSFDKRYRKKVSTHHIFHVYQMSGVEMSQWLYNCRAEVTAKIISVLIVFMEKIMEQLLR